MNDIDIARAAEMRDIREIAAQLRIEESQLQLYGKYKAKLPLSLIDQEAIKKNKLILTNWEKFLLEIKLILSHPQNLNLSKLTKLRAGWPKSILMEL